MNYYKINGQHGVYLLTKEEAEKALERENNGVDGEIKGEAYLYDDLEK